MDIEKKQNRRISGIEFSHVSSTQNAAIEYLDYRLSKPTKKTIYPTELSASNSIGRNEFSDTDIVQTVEIFFDSILDPSQTEAPIRELVGPLREPVLAAVKANPEFLTDARHPARRLIKLVFAKGREFSGDPNYQRNPYYLAVSRILNRLVSEYNNDERLFLRAFFDIGQLD